MFTSLKIQKSAQLSEHDNIWDDSLLIKAYEESVKLQKEEVAKQIAMQTNTRQNDNTDQHESGSSSQGFNVGDFVRSTFIEDGIDYEAEILTVNENGHCLIRFIGYGNEERVKMEDLVVSWGLEAREEQKILAEADREGRGETEEEHKEQLHNFVLNKAKLSRNSLPVPPMVSSNTEVQHWFLILNVAF